MPSPRRRLAARRAQGRPGGHLGAERRGVGARPVCDGEDRRDPRQRQPSYRAHELEYVVRQSGMTPLISQILNPPHTDFHALATEVSGTVPDLDLVFIDTVPAALIGDTAVGERESFARLLDEGRSLLEDPGAKYAVRLEQATGELSADDPINIQYTSGTTGFPKGVTLSHHNILNNGYFIAEPLSYTPDDSVVLSVPYYHCFGMVMGNLAALSHGASIVLPSPGFDPAASLTAVAEEKATSLYGVPTMFIAELGLPDFSDFDLSSARTGIMAGSPCPVEVMRHVIHDMNMSEVAICYGMTETSPVSTMTRVDDSLEARTETVGRVMPHVEVKIVDPVTGQTMPRGQKGELCTRGYSVMLGYWEEPEKTAEAIDSARWMHTGDLAIMDDDGYVDISGRIKDMVIRGGENVYPREIEEFLYQHPAISDVQVIGVSDEKYGEELMAWVILKDGYDTLTAEDVRGVRGRASRPLQDPSLRRSPRLLPDDGVGQDPQGRTPRGGRAHRPCELGHKSVAVPCEHPGIIL